MLKTYTQEALTASKWFFRSLKKGDWLWLIVAVIISSATVTVVKQLGETIQQSMLLKASQTLGADFVIQSTRPIDSSWQIKAEQLNLKTAQSISVVTMAIAQNQSGQPQFQLVQLKGTSRNQPLRGAHTKNSQIPFKALTKNSVWVEPKLLTLLNLSSQSQLTLGTQKFSLAGSIESSQSINPMASFAPQIWVSLAVMKQLGLTGPGSRVTYRLSVAGSNQAVNTFAKDVRQNQKDYWQIQSAQAPSKDLGNALETAWLFLDLSALSAVLVAGMSILIASRFYFARWKNSMALMRAFGANNAKMYRLFAMQLSWIALFSSLLGISLGYGISLAIMPFLAQYFSPLVSVPPYHAMSIGFISGLLVLWTFAWQAFQSAVKTSPIQILKSVPQQTSKLHWFMSFFMLLVLVSLMLNIDALFWVLVGVVSVSLLLYIASILLLKLMYWIQKYSRGWFKIALSNLTKEANLVQIQLVSVGMVLFVLMLMTVVRQDLLQNWQASLPTNTPNTFVMNIQPDQKESVDKILSFVPNKIEAPMVRGRLIAINKTQLNAKQQTSERAKRLLRREANIAVLKTLPSYNEVVEKTAVNQTNLPNVSVEQSIAKLFNIKLGDVLKFNIAGQPLDYHVQSIRKVRWQSFQLNFFFIIEPSLQRSLPVSYLSNFYLDNHSHEKNTPSSSGLTQQLVTETPGVLLINVSKIMAQINDIMGQASLAVTALYSFTLLASLAVLFTATLASQQARIQSWLLLRTLGATNQQIIKIGLTEFVFLGAAAGLLAASFAQVAGWLMSIYLLDSDASFSLSLWAISLFAGSIVFLFIGLVTQWGYLKRTPKALKRYTQ